MFSVTVLHRQPAAISAKLSDFGVRQDWCEGGPVQSHLRMRNLHVKPLDSKVFISDKGPTWKSILFFSTLPSYRRAQRQSLDDLASQGEGRAWTWGSFCVCVWRWRVPAQGHCEMTSSQDSWSSYHLLKGQSNQTFMPLGSPWPHPSRGSPQMSCLLTDSCMGLSEFPCLFLFSWVSSVNVLPF